jgi:hypothetical protein
MVDGLFDRATAAGAARSLMEGPARPDAIFVGNDHMAFAVMDAIRSDLGLRIPEDVSVVGYDDVPIAAGRPTTSPRSASPSTAWWTRPWTRSSPASRATSSPRRSASRGR